MQAASGHMDLMQKREPIDELVGRETTDPELRRRLTLVQRARDFSIAELKLPDNDSYRSYAELDRRYVLWNLFATPAYSLKPKQWCYPFLGCLAYRGYFNNDTTLKKAKRYADRGMDVAIGGVVAYSTLGRFADPLVDTMMRWDDTRLVGTLFHELAHQVIYISDDTMFNESFASAVEDIGVALWLKDDPERVAAFQQRKRTEEEILFLVEVARADLEALYAEMPDDVEIRKRARFEALSNDVASLLAARGLATAHWLVGDIGNAHLVPLALYDGLVPAFRELYTRCDEDFDCFYAQTKRLGGMPAEARDRELRVLLASASAPAASSTDPHDERRGTGSPGSMPVR
jgi:predicted aminopeptidase